MAVQERSWDVLIIGSGIAGLRSALALAEHHRVAVVTKKHLSESNTNYAQGGIASVLSDEDRFEYHVADTLTAGGGLCHEDVVRKVVQAGPTLIEDLVRQGIEFTRGEHGGFALGREGGHTQRRIVHAGDFTGRELEAALVERARSHPNVALLEDHLAVDLLMHADRVVGAQVLDRLAAEIENHLARVTLLASGGSGKVYRYTSNPDIATGDGVAMAYRAGATVANLEFFQFHPTCLFHPQAKNFLISEAVRGEGAILRNLAGEAFMPRYHEQADLAPRDVVARAIDQEMKQRGEDHVYLDTTVLDPAQALARFPNIAARCLDFGLDLRKQMLPVVPAAHYQCGGVVVHADGQSDLEGLFVVGEAACTGLHGANRLASNSLLEALYFAKAAVERIEEILPDVKAPRAGEGRTRPGIRPWPRATLRHDWEVARLTMWDYVGVVRDEERLQVALQRMAAMAQDAEEYTTAHRADADLLELRNVTLVGELMIRSALFRQESRGLHHMMDYPERDDERFLGDTRLQRDTEASLAPTPQSTTTQGE
jgi:L-aspartate oxidase